MWQLGLQRVLLRPDRPAEPHTDPPKKLSRANGKKLRHREARRLASTREVKVENHGDLLQPMDSFRAAGLEAQAPEDQHAQQPLGAADLGPAYAPNAIVD